MKFNIQQIIYFCLINYVFTFPNDLFDELWQTNQSGLQANNPIESQPKIKTEPDEEQFYERWQNKSAQKGIVKIEHEQHYGAIKVERTVKIKHEPHSEDVKVKLEQNDESQKDFIKVKVEEEHYQRLTTTRPKTEDGAQTSMAPKRQPPIVHVAHTSVSVEAEHESLKIISPLRKRARQIRAKSKMPQNESSEEDNCSEESEEANNRSSNETFEKSDYSESKDLMELNHKNDQQNSRKRICHSEEEKLKIVNKFLEMKQNLNTKVGKRSSKQIDKEMADKLGVNVRTIYQWKRDFGFSKKRLTSEEQTEIIKRFEKLKKENPQLSTNEIAKRLQISCCYLNQLKKQIQLGVVRKMKYHSKNKKISILKQYDKIKNANPRMSLDKIVKQLAISKSNLNRWRKEFGLPFNNKNGISEAEKREIIEKYDKMIGKKPQPVSQKDKKQIADKLGIAIRTIYKWKSKMGLKESHIYTKSERMNLLKKYYQIKRKNPELGTQKIAKMLNICKTSITKWQQIFANEINSGEADEATADDDLLIDTTRPLRYLLDDETWKWNFSTRNRKKNAF